jgi:MoaA/NifB/PqqE/SkfB family radical SAM enzyme
MGPTGEYAILQVHPARRCNLRCLHCYSRSGPDVDEALGLDLLARAVADARDLGYGVLGVSGGEPLLYRPLPDLLRAARAAGMRTTVTSNGMLLTQRRLAELAGLVDVLALSLDGTPETHVAMRQDPRAFRDLERRLPALRDSGIPFGFIVTLTQHNVHELAWVADFAARAGAGLLQVHPLEPEGYAADALAGSVPDPTELAYAFVESLRLGGSTDLAVQLDVVRRDDLRAHPEQFFAAGGAVPQRLGDWLTPLVVEASGQIVPLTYGLDPAYALGSLHDAPLAELAAVWDPAPFRTLCRDVRDRLVEPPGDAVVSWYEAVTAAARAAVPA